MVASSEINRAAGQLYGGWLLHYPTRDYVLWADAQGGWHCFTDRCPHRLATLSDGLVDKKSGEIVCAYHGWRFEVRGTMQRCTPAFSIQSHSNAVRSSKCHADTNNWSV